MVVLIDGTWSQAKQILFRYPFLSPRKPSVTGPGGRGLRLASSGGTLSVGGPQHPGKWDDRSQGAEEENVAGVGGYAAQDLVIGGGEQEKDGALCRAVKFRSAGVSSYGFRREPTKECLSTLESVAYTLEVIFLCLKTLILAQAEERLLLFSDSDQRLTIFGGGWRHASPPPQL